MRAKDERIAAPWWWPAVGGQLAPAIERLAGEQGQPVVRTTERMWAVLEVMLRPRVPTGPFEALFPEIVVSDVSIWERGRAFVAALASTPEVPLARLALDRIGVVARDGTLPRLPRLPRSRWHTGTIWNDVFARSTLGREFAFVRGTHRSHSGFRSYRTRNEHRYFSAILEIARRYGLVRASFSTGSPANASTYEDYAAFLDGGLVSKAGGYLIGLHGSWIVGRTALRFVCLELGLSPPRWPTASGPAPFHDELVRTLLAQLATERPLLLERLEEYEAR